MERSAAASSVLRLRSGRRPERSRTGGVIVVLVTCPTPAVARRLADHLVGHRLAACVNLLPAVHSTFWWQGKVERAREVLLLIKSTRRRFERLRRAILERHPYEVPEIIAVPLTAGHRPYLHWVQKVSGTAPSKSSASGHGACHGAPRLSSPRRTIAVVGSGQPGALLRATRGPRRGFSTKQVSGTVSALRSV